eukprot:Pgem_evm1s14986
MITGVMVFVTIGTGFIKPNISNFGGDQYNTQTGTKEEIASEKKEQQTFFYFFYFMINVGGVVAFGYLVNLASSGSGSISKQNGYFAAYLIAFGAMVLAVVLFFSGTRRYVRKAVE